MIKIRKPSRKSLALYKAGVDLLVGSPASLENAAKILVVLETTLLTAYISFFTFLKTNPNLVIHVNANTTMFIIMFIWSVSVFSTAKAFMPSERLLNLNDVDEIGKSLDDISKTKLRYLSIGFALFMVFDIMSLYILWLGT